MKLRTFVIAIVLLAGTTSLAQQTIYWKKDHIYNGPGGKEIAVMMPTPTDTTAPSAPTSLSIQSTGSTSVALQWTGSSDTGGSGLAGYKVYRRQGSGANLPVGTVTGTSFTDQPLTPSVSYTYTVVAFDNAQNHSAASNSVSTTTGSAPADTTAPSIPQNLQAQFPTWNSVLLSWKPSIDIGGSGLANYRVYKNGTLIASPTARTYTDTGLSATTNYTYSVAAIDNAGNLSTAASVSITTPRELVFTDNFQRPDSFASMSSSNWLSSLGTLCSLFGVSSGMANLPAAFYDANGGPGWSMALATPSQTHFRATALVPANSNGTQPGITFWGNCVKGYRAHISSGPNYVNVFLSFYDSQGNHTITGVTTYSAGPAPWNLSVVGDDATRTITVFLNGTQQISYTETDTSRPNSGYIGLAGYMQYAYDVFVNSFTLEK